MSSEQLNPPPDAWKVLQGVMKRDRQKRRGLICMPEVDFVDGDTVRIFFPESDTRITFELLFPSIDARDQFQASGKTRKDAEKFGAIVLTNRPAIDAIENGVEHEQDGDQPEHASASAYELALLHGLKNPGEFIDASNLAWKTLCIGESKKKSFPSFIMQLIGKS
ncbi:MAG: hypothetical protein WC880_02330 [Candidatus Paceibacterota bacterium]